MSQPLTGLTILDLTHVLAGPFASAALGALGARVIKVERPGRGDDARAFPPFKDGRSAYFAALNHGKASIALDLRDAADRETFERLLARADVLLEAFRPGVMDKFGYGWEALHRRFPALIYGAVSGFGQSGPDAKRPAYDLVAQARGGMMSITGAGMAAPVATGSALVDILAGQYLVQGVLAALYARAQGGGGRRIDVALLDAQVAALEHAIPQTAVSGKPPGAAGGRHPAVAPVETVQAADGPFVLAAGNDKLFEKLCTALALPIATDPRFAGNAERVANARLLKRLIEAVTLERPRGHWIARLSAAGIPVAPIQSVDQVLNDPQVLARNMVVDVLDRNGRKAFVAAGNPVKISGVEDRTSRPPAPDLDGNRGEILRWLDEA